MKAADNHDKTSQANPQTKKERLEARVTVWQKQIIRRAAHLKGQSLTDFIVNSVQEAAIETLQEHEILRLSEQDREIFLDALLNPPAPTEKARADAQWYKQQMEI